MRARLLATILLVACSSAVAAPWNSAPKPLNGSYQIYGGELGDMKPPAGQDRKLSLVVTGALARELFDNIGPDLKLACSDAPGYRERQRGDLSCTRDTGGYRCTIGMNVATGKSMGGSIC
jgi:hypothetical protein